MSCLKNRINATCKFAVISDVQAETKEFLYVLDRISNSRGQWVSALMTVAEPNPRTIRQTFWNGGTVCAIKKKSNYLCNVYNY